MKWWLLCLAVALAAFGQSQELKGAGELLRRLNAPPVIKPEESGGVTWPDLRAFEKDSAKMSAPDAVKGWITLVDRVLSEKPTDLGEPSVGFTDVVEVLPPPTTWHLLLQELKKRDQSVQRNRGLVLLGYVLTGTEAEQWDAIAKLQPRSGKEQLDKYWTFHESIAIIRGDADRLFHGLNRRLALGGTRDDSFAVSEILPLLGPQRTEQFLTDAFTKLQSSLQFTGDETKAFAVAVALKNAGRLKSPPWDLAESDNRLYYALLKRFPLTSEENVIRSKSNRVFELLLAGKEAEAMASGRELSTTEWQRLGYYEQTERVEAAGRQELVMNFFVKLMLARNDNSMWYDVMQLAHSLGKVKDILPVLEVQAARKDLSESESDSVRPALVDALLSVGRVDEAIKELRAHGKHSYTSGDLFGVATELHRDDLAEEGLKRRLAELDADFFGSDSTVGEIGQYLLQRGRVAEYEQLLFEQIDKRSREVVSGYQTSKVGDLLVKLAALYQRSGRNEDVLLLLDRAPGWGAQDLSGLISGSYTYEGGEIALVAARALAALGRKSEAENALILAMLQSPHRDSLFEVYIDLAGESALPFLERLCAGKPSAATALAWKGEVLRRLGRPEEAELALRAAVGAGAQPPYYGETGSRAYEMLAIVLDARGKTQEAKAARDRSASRKKLDEGNSLLAQGLRTHAAAAYREAVNLDPQYSVAHLCLAWALFGLGERVESQTHLLAALRHLEVFGESYLLSEMLAKGKHQRAAEGYLTDQLKTDPNLVAAHWAMGELRSVQKRRLEALGHYRRVAELQPDNAEALSNWLREAKFANLPRSEIRQIELRMVEKGFLGPSNNTSYMWLFATGEWSALEPVEVWEAINKGGGTIEVPDKVLTLTASAEAIRKATAAGLRPRNDLYSNLMRADAKNLTASRTVAQMPLVSEVARYIMEQ